MTEIHVDLSGSSDLCEYCGGAGGFKVLKKVEGLDLEDLVILCPRCLVLVNTVKEHPELIRKLLPVELKEVFMKLGNELVTRRGFTPAGMVREHEMDEPNTLLLAELARWFNDHPAAREELELLGLKWRV